ncbi:MAG: hypothetical protein ACKN9W_02250 [Methylococcus sp.]
MNSLAKFGKTSIPPYSYSLRQAPEGQPSRPLIASVDVRLPKAQEADDQVDTVVQPDVLVVRDPGKLDRRSVRGAPVDPGPIREAGRP